MRVLFTNAGRRTYLVEFALAAAQDRGIEIFVSDCDPLVPAFHVDPSVGTLTLPPVLADPAAYLEALRCVVRTRGIGLILPLSDLDLNILAGNAALLAGDGATAVISPADAVEACVDKRESERFCRVRDIAMPDSWYSLDEFPGRYPAIRKRIRGSGSAGLAHVAEPAGLAGFAAGEEMLQAFVGGDEFGIDILNDFSGRFVSACVKQKLLMRAGETDRAQIVDRPDLLALARRISAAFRHVGNLDVDVRADAGGNLYCLDFNPRFGGGYPATHLAGFDYLAAIFDMALGRPVRLPERPRPVIVSKGISVYAAAAAEPGQEAAGCR